MNEAKVHLLRRLWGLISLPPQQLRRSQPYYWRGSGSAVADFVRSSVGRETATAAGGWPGEIREIAGCAITFHRFLRRDIAYMCLIAIHISIFFYHILYL